MKFEPYRTLWEIREARIAARCEYILDQYDISAEEVQRHLQTLASQLSQKNLDAGAEVVENGSWFIDPSFLYTRPMARTLWSECLDLRNSIVNEPVNRTLLEELARGIGIRRYWLVGYLAALTLLKLMDGLAKINPRELISAVDFGGPYEEGGPDWTAFELDGERNNMMENFLGKAEEFLFKADALAEASALGAQSAPPTDRRWEKLALEYLEKNKKKIELEYRKKSGVMNRRGLARKLDFELAAAFGEKRPSERTVADRLKSLLPQAGIELRK
jgi:hypothetical protein